MKRILLAGVISLAIVGRVSAQSPADRVMLSAWDDSLQAVIRVTEIAKLLPRVAIPGTAAPLRKAMYDLRKSELTDERSDLARVQTALLLDASAHPSWPWPTFVLARNLILLHRARAQSGPLVAQLDGESIASAAWRFLAATLKKDQDFAPARNLFFDLLVATGERELHEDQLVPLQREVKRKFPDPRAMLVWGRQLRAAGRYDSALKVFTRAGLAGEDRARLAIERARTFRGIGDTASARVAYWDGLERPSAKGRVAYRYDIAWLITADSLAIFDKVPNDSLVGWMHRFWEERDAAAANQTGERLQEHLHRWIIAVSRYRVRFAWRKTDFTRTDMVFDGIYPCVSDDPKFYDDLWAAQPTYPDDIRDRERLLDQRGLIYLRHGEPIRMLGGNPDSLHPRRAPSSTSGRGMLPGSGSFAGFFGAASGGSGASGASGGRGKVDLPRRPIGDPIFYGISQQMAHNVSWLYWFEGEWRMLNFRGSAAFGIDAPTTLASYLPTSDIAPQSAGHSSPNPLWYAAVVTPLIPEYAAAASALEHTEQPTCETAVKAAITKARDDGHTAIISDSDSPPLLDPWRGAIGMYALGHSAEPSGEALVTFAIPTDKLRSVGSVSSSGRAAVHFRIVAYHPQSGASRVIDTVRSFAFKPIDGTPGFVTGWFEIPLGAGTWEVAMKVNQGSDSSGMYALNRHILISGESPLSLSDIVLGVGGANPWMAPDNLPFAINTLTTWPAGSKAAMYFEVRGVPVGDTYKTSIQIRGADSLAKQLIDVSSNDVSAGAVTHVRKSIGLESLPAGNYSLLVTVTANGRSVKRRAALLVLPATTNK